MKKSICTALFLLCLNILGMAQATVSINGSQQFQTIDGFGVSVNTAWWYGGAYGSTDVVKPAIDLLADNMGANIFRAVIEEMDWEAVNDDADPNNFNWTYYNSVYSNVKFQGVWNTLRYLNQKGITNRLVISLMGAPPSWMGSNAGVNTDKEDEFVETIASLLYYARNTAGIQFTLVSPLNETEQASAGIIEGPNITNAQQFVRIMKKLAVKLDAIGMSDIRFIGPDAAGEGLFQSLLPAMVNDAVVMSKLTNWGVHQYGSDASGYNNFINSSASSNKSYWVTETAGIQNMLGQLDDNNKAILFWDGFDCVYQHSIRNGNGSTPPNDYVFSFGEEGKPVVAYNPSNKTWTPRKQFYEFSQLFKFVVPGAVRIGASTSNSNLRIYSYLNPGGQLVIFGRNNGSSSITINGTLSNVSASIFQLYQTNATLNMQRGTDLTVNAGAFSLPVAAGTIFTLIGSAIPVTGVTVTPATANINGTQQLSATVTPTNASNKTLTWSSSNTAIATVNTSGLVTGIATGTATITATTQDGNKSATALVTVTGVAVPVANVSVSPLSAIVNVNGTQQLTATILPGNASNKNVSWASSNISIATVSSSGLVTGVAAGAATITVTTQDGSKTASTAVTVAQAGNIVGYNGPGTITDNISDAAGTYVNVCRYQALSNLNLTTIKAKVLGVSGKYKCAIYSDNSNLPQNILESTAEVINPSTGWQTFTLNSMVSVTSGTWYWLAIWCDQKSTAPGIYCDATGGVSLYSTALTYGAWPTPLSTAGGATLKYCIYAEDPGSASVPVSGVNVSPASASLIVAATIQLTQTINPSNATNKNVTWSSGNTAIATVSTSGLVRAVAAGTAIITVTTIDGSKTATATITVTKPTVAVTRVTVSPTKASLAIAATKQLKQNISPSTATNKKVTWSSDNTAIATVSTSGLVRAVAAGTAIITVTTDDGSKTATATITVLQAAGCTAEGKITYQKWNGITGTTVNNLTGNANYPNTPAITTELTSFEASTNVDDNYGARIAGYICAPQTGGYTFWIAGDDNVELWLSTTDQASGKVKIAYHTSRTNSREWNKFPTQKSAVINLTAGQRYYIEALMKEGTGGDNLAAGWRKPNDASDTVPSEIVPGSVLSKISAQQATEYSVLTTQVPAGSDSDQPYELGMKFKSTQAGNITRIRYYKISGEGGTHTGRIWSSSGTQLASVNFAGETATGWQMATLATPLSITANTTYIVSVNNNNVYASTNNGLQNSIVNNPLSSIADGANGVYNTTPGLFPNNSYLNSNYFCDVVFTPTLITARLATAAKAQYVTNDLVIYPNPATGYFQIEFTNEGSANIVITNPLGQPVMNFKRVGNIREKINLSSHGVGLYMLSIRNSKGISTKKIVIVK